MTKKKERAIVVYTDKRGVFFGYTCAPFNREQMTLRKCRMAVYWDQGGVLGLSSDGPGPGCRITNAVPSQVLVDLHGETECTPAAVERWESQPWK